ncbi:MAG: peptidoglycan-binding protein [Actinomycetota bacterium]|nr:peptidoglycan-binding protein [Actinomycetota bacterium]
MDRTLQLTSPLMTGPDVKELQTLLRKAGYLDDVIDGEYGPLTAQAVYRAKFRLGYRSPDQTAAGLLVSYLDGTKEPTEAMKKVAAERNKKPKAGSLTPAQRKVQKALSQLGQKENPADSNRCKYTAWYGMVGAWCAMYMTWIHAELGMGAKSFRKGTRYAYVPFVVADARAGKNGLMLAAGPSDGVLACFDWQGDGVADHIGMCAEEPTVKRLVPDALNKAVRQFGSLGAGDFWCVEGNTAVGNDSNGGSVMLRKRNRKNVQSYVKVAV